MTYLVKALEAEMTRTGEIGRTIREDVVHSMPTKGQAVKAAMFWADTVIKRSKQIILDRADGSVVIYRAGGNPTKTRRFLLVEAAQ